MPQRILVSVPLSVRSGALVRCHKDISGEREIADRPITKRNLYSLVGTHTSIILVLKATFICIRPSAAYLPFSDK